MDEADTPIRTPDQRLRVFVSSTLKELAAERQAVRSAIEGLQLAPVMFELGSRPHPPRSLYRSYLAQSDVFVGIYGERYGWVAPGEAVSGLEDEYALSGELPSLIYVLDPAPEREPRLAALLDRIRADDRVSYRAYRDPDELATLVRQDLATLLAERFDAGRPRGALRADAMPGIPAPYSAIVGRDAERDALLAMLARPDVRIVTIVGDGGIGKSRLAIEVAGAAAAAGRPVAFAMLETITVPERAITVIARSLGVRDTGDAPLEQKVVEALADRDVLLVVDNVEHVLGAVGLLVRLIGAAPRLTLLVTSRSPLRVRAERLFPLGPLEAAAAAALFEERAAAVRPGFRLGPENAATVAEICRRLDGSPLAIELAAARMVWMPVDELLRRLESALTLLVGGARDLPERQRALRSTIQWSVDLLEPGATEALTALAVPAGPFAGSTAEQVLGAAGIADPTAAITALAEASLLRHEDHRGAPMLALPVLVRAFAREAGPASLLETARAAWIDHYRRVASDAEAAMRGASQLATLRRLDLEAENLGGVVRLLLDDRRLDDAAEHAWSLYLYHWIAGHLGLVREWMTELLALAERESIPLGVRTRAIALYYTHAIRFWQEPTSDVVPGMQASRDLFAEADDPGGAALADVSIGLGLLTLPDGPDVPAATAVLERSRAGFRAVGDTWGEAMTLVMLGRIALLTGDIGGARERFEESLALATAQHELLGIGIARNHRGWARLFAGDVDGAADDLGTSLDESLALGHDEGVAYGLEGFVGVRGAQGDAATAGVLQGAAQALRRRKGALNRSGFDFSTMVVARLRDGGAGDAFDAAAERGATMPLVDVLALVRAP